MRDRHLGLGNGSFQRLHLQDHRCDLPSYLHTEPIVGKIADLAGGDYGPAYLFMGVCCVIGYICTMIAYKLVEDNSKK